MTPSLRFCLLLIIVGFADAKMDDAGLQTATDEFLKLFKTMHGPEYAPLSDIRSTDNFLGSEATIEATGGTFGKISDLYISRPTSLKRDDEGSIVSVGVSGKQLKVAYERFFLDFSTDRAMGLGLPLAFVCKNPVINLDLRIGNDMNDGSCHARVHKVVASNLEGNCMVEAGNQPALNWLLTSVERIVHHIFKNRVESWMNEKVSELIDKEIANTMFIFCAVNDA